MFLWATSHVCIASQDHGQAPPRRGPLPVPPITTGSSERMRGARTGAVFTSGGTTSRTPTMTLVRLSFLFSLPLAGAGAGGGGGSVVQHRLFPLVFLVDDGWVVVHQRAESAGGKGLLREAIQHLAVGLALAKGPLDRVPVDVRHHPHPLPHPVHPAAVVGAHPVQAVDAADVETGDLPLLAVPEVVLCALAWGDRC